MVILSNSQDPTKNGFVDFLQNYGIFLAIGVAVIVLGAVVAVLLLQRNKKDVAPKKEYSSNEVFDALGGKENVLSHSIAGSRISLTLSNYDNIDEKKLNELGVSSIIKMSNKITLVVKDDPNSFYKMFN